MTSPNNRQEFLSWLTRNKSVLEKYDADEIAHFARLNEFDLSVICELLPHWISDRATRTSYRTREWWYVDRELDSVNLLRDSWDHLGRYLMTGKGFGE